MLRVEAIKDLGLMDIEGLRRTKDEVFEFFMERNLHKVAIGYITKLWDYTKEIAGSIINIGKIILSKIMDFIIDNKNMAFGAALGAIAGAMLTPFVGWIPFLGSALSALTIGGGMLIGAIAGNRMDRADKGEFVDTGVLAVFGDTIEVAKKFLILFIDIFQTLKNS